MTSLFPPKWADRFLEWYCRPDKLEEIQGDAYELFYRKARENKRIAALQFTWNVIRFFRLKNIRHNSSHTNNCSIMLTNYLKIGFRNALRNRSTTIINVLGLSLGIAAAITSFIFMDFMIHIDGFHANKERIYQISSQVQETNKIRDWGDSPLMLGPALKNDQASVESFARVEFGSGAVRYNETVFTESLWFVDPSFTQMFSFPLTQGNAHVLDSKNNIIITTRIAEKYFGTTDPLGQILSIKFSNGAKEELVVGGVIRIPQNSGMQFGFLLPMEKFEDLKFKDSYDWSYLTDATFVMLKPGHSIAEITGMAAYKTLQNNSSPQFKIEGFDFIPLTILASRANSLVSAISYAASPTGVWSLGAIALMLLLLACFNYMNVAIATVTTRLKEIGIRKVVGGRKKEIIQQFLTENFLLCTLSILAGAGVSYAFFLPGFNSLFPFEIPFALSSGNTAFVFFFSLLVFISLVSGAYPAVYVSTFAPISILRGREKFGQRSLFSRMLLTMQFVLAFTTIVGSFVFIDNALYQKNKDWGYSHHQTITVPAADKTQYLALRDKVAQDKQIESIAGSVNHVGRENTQVSFEYLQQRIQTVSYKIDFNYLETMEMRLNAGRFFNRDIQSDRVESVVVNESFVSRMGWKEPLNQSFEYDTVKRYVIGVVRDFHYDGFYDPIGPAMFSIANEDDLRYVVVKVNKDHLAETESTLRAAWRQIAPDDPYLGFYQDSVFEQFHNDNNSNVKLLSFISGMAVVLACLGLFGLVAYNITRRLKEFSVRKVFGANLLQIFRLMNRDYAWILLTSFLIGAPAGFFLINALIHQIYPEPQDARIIPFAIAISLMMVTVAITIASQLNRVARENPTVTLRAE